MKQITQVLNLDVQEKISTFLHIQIKASFYPTIHSPFLLISRSLIG